mgnify:CR=1 FL=1
MCVKTWMRISVGLFVAGLVLLAAVIGVCALIPGAGEYGLPMCIVPLLVFGGSALARDHSRGLLQDMNFLCCPNCTYDLSKHAHLPGDPDVVRCPECGEVFGIAAMEQHWRSRFVPQGPPSD